MKVGYNKTLGFLFLGSSLVLIIIAFMADGLPLVRFIVPVVFLQFGFATFTRMYFSVDGHTLVLYALIGPLRKRYTFTSWNDVRIEGTTIWLKQQTETKRINLSVWLVDLKEWQAFRTFVEQKQQQ